MTEQYTAPVNLEGIEANYDLYQRSRTNNSGWSCGCGLAHHIPPLVAEVRKLRVDLGEVPNGGPGDINLEFVASKHGEYLQVRGTNSTKEAALKQFLADVAPAMLGEIRRRRRNPVVPPDVKAVVETHKLSSDVRAVVETLLTVSSWVAGGHCDDQLTEVADRVAREWSDTASCPVCEETWCDSGCPLKPRRDARMTEEMLNRFSGDRCVAVSVLLEEHAKFKKSDAKLRALEAFGVDNWEVYDEAMQSLDNPGVNS